MARPIIEASQKNKDNLLQILLYKEYREYKKNIENDFVEIDDDREPIYTDYKLLSFDEWLEKILGEF